MKKKIGTSRMKKMANGGPSDTTTAKLSRKYDEAVSKKPAGMSSKYVAKPISKPSYTSDASKMSTIPLWKKNATPKPSMKKGGTVKSKKK